MREIKFRVWNTASKLMVFPGWRELADRAIMAEMKLMQFTGLKDNGDKEIYEGDILYVMGTGNCPVRFYEGSFVLWEGYNAWTSFLDDFEGDISMKVLGNIYENPELLDVNCVNSEQEDQDAN